MRTLFIAALLLSTALVGLAPTVAAEHPCYVDEDGNETCTDHGPWYGFCWDPGMRKIFRLVCG